MNNSHLKMAKEEILAPSLVTGDLKGPRIQTKRDSSKQRVIPGGPRVGCPGLWAGRLRLWTACCCHGAAFSASSPESRGGHATSFPGENQKEKITSYSDVFPSVHEASSFQSRIKIKMSMISH